MNMCGRYAMTTDPAKLAAEIDAINKCSPLEGLGELQRCADGHDPTVVERHHADQSSNAADRYHAVGLSAMGQEIGKFAVQRAETAAEKRRSARQSEQRYLMPTDGWYSGVKPSTTTEGDKGPLLHIPGRRHAADQARLWSAWRAKTAPTTPLLSYHPDTDAVGRCNRCTTEYR